MSTATVLPSGLTWDEFLALPDEPRYKHAELVDGEVVADPANWLHQHIVAELVGMIREWIRAGTGRGGVTMDPPVKIRDNRGYLPDVAWYQAGRDRPRQVIRTWRAPRTWPSRCCPRAPGRSTWFASGPTTPASASGSSS